jgi:hypothetical protein
MAYNLYNIIPHSKSNGKTRFGRPTDLAQGSQDRVTPIIGQIYAAVNVVSPRLGGVFARRTQQGGPRFSAAVRSWSFNQVTALAQAIF